MKLKAFSSKAQTGRKQVSVEDADKKQIILFCSKPIPTSDCRVSQEIRY